MAWTDCPDCDGYDDGCMSCGGEGGLGAENGLPPWVAAWKQRDNGEEGN